MRMSTSVRRLVFTNDEAFLKRDVAEWEVRLEAHGVGYQRVRRFEELLTDPQAAHIGAFEAREGAFAEYGKAFVALPMRFSEAGPAHKPRGPAPQLGEHTEAVLGGKVWSKL